MKQTGYIHMSVEVDEKQFFFAMPMNASVAQATDASLKIFKSCDKMYRDAVDKELKQQEELRGSEEEKEENAKE